MHGTSYQTRDDPEKTVPQILKEFKLHNAEVLMREDCSTDELIDVISNRNMSGVSTFIIRRHDPA